MSDQKLTISWKTWVRTAVLLLSVVNSVLTAMDINPLPFSDEQAYAVFSALAAAAAAIWSWWENNSFTQAALTADEVLKELEGD